MKTRKRQLIVGLTVYIAGSLIFAVITYFNTHRHLIQDIDQRLLVAAYATETLVGDLHSQSMDESTIDAQLDYQTSLLLTDFVRRVNIDYVYSMILINDAIVFVTSNATEEELADNTYLPAYFMAYGEADDSLREVFNDKEIRYSEYTDRWGDFRSVFVPFTADDGRVYVIGADISLADVIGMAWQSAVIALSACFGLGLIGLPLMYLYTQSLNRESKLVLERLYRCPLTGLPNRNRLLEDIKAVDVANISIINIDKFREITTLYGPAVGDDVLKQFSLRLSRIDSSALDNYKAYRLNADEFATLVTGIQDPPLLKTQLDKLYDHLIKHPYQAGIKRVQLRIRMGAATDGEDAFILADMALREARDTNKSLVIYDSKLKLPEAYRLNFEQTQSFRRALDEKRLVPYFQPLLNTTTGKFDKYECLARMVDDTGKVVGYPDDFLPIAYRSRLYNRFTRLMLDNIFDSINKHHHTVSVNLSVSDINHDPTVQYLFDRLSNPKIAQRIEFEIMENENIENLGKIVRFIQRVKSFGCRVGLDDLGKDYSNIDRLIALPVDFVKIDGNVIMHLATDKEAQDLARMIISFSYKRQILTVAEFCWDAKTSEMARRLGVDYLQGYYIGEPKAEFAQPLSAEMELTVAS